MKELFKKGARRFILLALCASLCMWCAPLFSGVGSAAEGDATTQSYEERLRELQAEQDRLMNEINSLRAEEDSATQYKASLDQLASTTQTKIVLSRNLLTQLENQIAMTEEEISELELTMEDTMDKYLARVRESREDGNASYIELILGSEGIADFLTRMERVNSIFEYDRSLMEKYEAQQAELESKRAALESSRESEAATMASLENDQAYYDELVSQQEAYISSLMKDEGALLAQYNEVKAAEEALNAELEAYITKLQQQSQVIYSGEGFIRPIAPGVGYVSSGYGWRTLWGQADLHEAVDIACASGTNILASANGTVIRSEWHWSYGYYVIIDHGSGISTLYAHCSALLVSVGTEVRQGDVIALVGATGTVTGEHVHVELRENGRRVDPNTRIPF